jgi:hypothetical protein
MIPQDKLAALEKAVAKWRYDPNLFFEEILGCTPEPYQRQINQAIADHERVAISACHDVGKSWDLARIVLWFGTCFPYCKVITTAPTYNQVKNILWSEIRSAFAKSKAPLGGRMNLTEWQVTKEGDWFALGFTPRNELTSESGQGTQSSFQGFHAPYILIVFDEATGIPFNIWTMAEGIMTSANVKFVAIGNPTSRMAEFFKCFSSPEWHKIKLSCFDSPNLIANGITDIEKLRAEVDIVRSLNDSEAQARMRDYKVVKPYLLSLKWVVSMAMPRKWGIEHPLFISKCLGEFPKDSDGTLMPLGYVEEAMLRTYWPTDSDRKTMGVDVARFGTDATVMTMLHGKKWTGRRALIKKGTMEVAGECIALNREQGPFDVIVVDETGIGGGVVDALNEAKRENPELRNTEIRGVQFGAACADDENKAKFVNLKARMFRLLSDDLRSTDGLTLPGEAEYRDIYLDELPTILYAYDSKGRMLVESKDDYKKRTGRKSPDDADSLALANFGRYDEIGVGSLLDGESGSWAKPFAAGLTGGKQW